MLDIHKCFIVLNCMLYTKYRPCSTKKGLDANEGRPFTHLHQTPLFTERGPYMVTIFNEMKNPINQLGGKHLCININLNSVNIIRKVFCFTFSCYYMTQNHKLSITLNRKYQGLPKEYNTTHCGY